MTVQAQFRCQNCGEKFVTEVLTEEERIDARLKNQPTSPIHCPKCNRTDVRQGWG